MRLREVINTTQKGFLLYKGCFEHVFLLRLCLEDARKRKRKIGVTWFGLLDQHQPNIRPGNGKAHTDVVECQRSRDIKQGCSLNPILLDLVMEQVVSDVEGNKELGYNIGGGEKVAILAYTDDLCLMAESPERLQMILDWAGPKF